MRRKIPLMAGTLALTAAFAIGGVSAFFTDRIDLSSVLKVKAKAVNEDCIEMTFFDEKEAVGLMPGDRLLMSPVVTNVNGEDSFVFMEVSSPVINSSGILKPIFSYEKSSNWHFVQDEISGNKKTEIYCFGRTLPEALATGESTDPLFSQVTFMNLPGNESLSDTNVSITCKAILVKASKIKYENNYKNSKNLYALVLADEKEEISKAYLKESVIGIGKLKVEIAEKEDAKDSGGKEEDRGEDENNDKQETIVENTGDTSAVVFLKVRSLKPPVLKPGVEDLIYLGKDNDEYVFGLTSTLKEGESTEDLSDKLEVDGILETKVASIQAKNLMKDGEAINTQGRMGKETLKDIYRILSQGMGGFFTDEDIVVEEEKTKGRAFIRIEEVFDGSKALKVGENNYEKRVTVRNIGESSQYVRVKLGFSEEGIEDKLLVYTGTGDFVKVQELKNVLNTGWEYSEENGEKYFIYKNKLAPGDVTSPLFTHVRIVFENTDDITDFDIFVEAEGKKEAFL